VPGARPTPKARYDAIIVGAGGHGLATAYYLGKNHGITNVAVIEKGWLGGGNTGRNTTIIRSNYLQDPSAAIYEKARSLYETLSQDLNYNIMFSPRGVMMLAQTQHEVRGYQRTAHANALQGVTTEFIGPEGQGTVPDHQHQWPPLPGSGRALATARRHRAP
jgi:sarcosine oxidase subunit beta